MTDETNGEDTSETLPAVRKPQPILAGSDVRPIVPQSMEQAFRIAQLLASADWVPSDMRNPNKLCVAIMHGLEIGLPPMQAVQRIAVIKGRPCLWGDAAIGLVRASGKCQYIKEWIEGEGDEMVAHCESKRREEDFPVTTTFSVADAKAAGLWNKDGPWKMYKKRMLQMRARGFNLRDGYADVLGGMYLAEEMQGSTDFKDVTPAPVERVLPPPAPTDGIATAEVIHSYDIKSAKGKPKSGPRKKDAKAYVDLGSSEAEADVLTADQTDKYLEDLSQRLDVVPNVEELEQIAEEHVTFFMARLFPPDRDKASALIDKAKERFA